MKPVRFMATKSKFMPSTLNVKRVVPFSSEVLINLSVEGEGPGKEVDPANDVDQDLLPMLHIINLSK